MGRLLRDRTEHVWSFPSPTMPSCADTETEICCLCFSLATSPLSFFPPPSPPAISGPLFPFPLSPFFYLHLSIPYFSMTPPLPCSPPVALPFLGCCWPGFRDLGLMEACGYPHRPSCKLGLRHHYTFILPPSRFSLGQLPTLVGVGMEIR